MADEFTDAQDNDTKLQNDFATSDALKYFAYACNTATSESRKMLAKKAGEWAGRVIDKIDDSDYFKKQLDGGAQEKLSEQWNWLSRDVLRSTAGWDKFRDKIGNDIGENEQFAKDVTALYSAGKDLLRELSYQELVLGDDDAAPGMTDNSYFEPMLKHISNTLGDIFTQAVETWRADTEVQDDYFTEECRKRFEGYENELSGTATRILAALATVDGLFDIDTERFRKATKDRLDSMLNKYEKEMDLQVKKAKESSKEDFKTLSRMLESMGSIASAEQTSYHG